MSAFSVQAVADAIEGPRSSAETPVKYHDLEYMLRIYLKLTASILRRKNGCHPEYLYFDLNAGNGVNDDLSLGSPLIFRKVADEVGLPFRAWLFEGHRPTLARLSWSVAEDARFTVVGGDHRETVHQVAAGLGMRSAYGLIYADPNNGLLEASVPVIQSLLNALPANCVDVLWYGSGANVKRVAGAHGHARLVPQIEAIAKRNWFLRKPRAKHQWTFGFGTNWKDAPEPGQQFGQIGTELGDRIASLLNETNEERREKVERPLFLLPGRGTLHTEGMANTFGIPGSGRSARLRSTVHEDGASGAAPEQLRCIT